MLSGFNIIRTEGARPDPRVLSEDAPVTEPMRPHDSSQRRPSADELKVRRQMAKNSSLRKAAVSWNRFADDDTWGAGDSGAYLQVQPYDEEPGWVYLVQTTGGETVSGRVLKADGKTVEDAKDIAEAVLDEILHTTGSKRITMQATALNWSEETGYGGPNRSRPEWVASDDYYEARVRPFEVAPANNFDVEPVLVGYSWSLTEMTEYRGGSRPIVTSGHGQTLDETKANAERAMANHGTGGERNPEWLTRAIEEVHSGARTSSFSRKRSTMDTKTFIAQSRRRETQMLAAMAKANHAEQQRLAADIEDLRAQRKAALDAERSINLADTVVTARSTPVVPHTLTTASTDWLGDVPEETADLSSISQHMRTEATLWYQRTHPEVRADREEFAVQARGKARHLASSYGFDSPAAQRAFLDQVSHITGRRVTAEEDEWAAEGEATGADGDVSSATDPRGRSIDPSAQGESTLPTPEGNPATFDTLMPAIPAADDIPSQVVEENRTASRRVLSGGGDTCDICGTTSNVVQIYSRGREVEYICYDHEEQYWDARNAESKESSRREANWDDEYISSCPACGSAIDYCQGHGEIGDPEGNRILDAHDSDDHRDCHPDGCEEADTDGGFLASRKTAEEILNEDAQGTSGLENAEEDDEFWSEPAFAGEEFTEAARRQAGYPSGSNQDFWNPGNPGYEGEDWERQQRAKADADGAADVADVPTPGQEIADYPQPKGAKRVVIGGRVYQEVPQGRPSGSRRASKGVTAGDQSFSQWCEQVEQALGGSMGTDDGYDEEGPNVHELNSMFESGMSPSEVASKYPEMKVGSRKQAASNRTCRFCGEEIESAGRGVWIETRSGDDGGSYDYCADNGGSPDEGGGHKPGSDKESSRKQAANVVADSFGGLGEKLRGMGLEIREVNYSGEGGMPEGGGMGYRKIEIKVDDGHWHQETVQLVPSSGQWIVSIPSWITSEGRRSAGFADYDGGSRRKQASFRQRVQSNVRKTAGAVTIVEGAEMNGDLYQLPAIVARGDKVMLIHSGSSFEDGWPDVDSAIGEFLARVRDNIANGNVEDQDVTLYVYRDLDATARRNPNTNRQGARR